MSYSWIRLTESESRQAAVEQQATVSWVPAQRFRVQLAGLFVASTSVRYMARCRLSVRIITTGSLQRNPDPRSRTVIGESLVCLPGAVNICTVGSTFPLHYNIQCPNGLSPSVPHVTHHQT